jgi:hypothetical protein
MKPLFPVLLLLAFCTNATAQLTKKNFDLEPYAQARIIAKLNLLSLIDPEAPTLQPGMEVKFNKRLSGEFAIGIPLGYGSEETDSTYFRFYKLKAEIRYFPFERRAFYLASELSYVSRERDEYNGIFVAKDREVYGYDYAQIDKNIFAVAFKAGAVLPFRKNSRWLMDFFAGAGPRFVKTEIKAINVRPDAPGWMFWNRDRQGSSAGLHLTVGFKIARILF